MSKVWQEGIDVSQWQGVINWSQVRESGCKFAFVKATEGATYQDPMFRQNYLQATGEGIFVGAYHYLRSTSTVAAQVEHFVQAVEAVRGSCLLPVLDVEDPKQWQGKLPAELSEMVVDWLTKVEQRLEIQPLVYLSPSFAEEMLAPDLRLARFPLWLAHWTAGEARVPKPWAQWTFWQYSSQGTIAGITANVVDLDRFHSDMQALHALFTRS